jgi:hypothetical protein
LPSAGQLGEARLSGERQADRLELVIVHRQRIVKNTMTPSPAKCSSVPW